MVFGRSVSLDWRKGGDQPVEVIDFGPQTVGGYAVFEVADFISAADGALPVLRLSYATHPDGLSPTGDFSRETHATYLHVDNPVLPANINRHELYTIPRIPRAYLGDSPRGERPPTGFTLPDGEMVRRLSALYGARRADAFRRRWEELREHGQD